MKNVLPSKDCTPVEITELHNSADKIRIYPNPTKDALFVEVAAAFSGEWKIQVLNPMGVELFNTTQSDRTFNLDLSNYSSGMYLLVISDGIQSAYRKVVVER